MPNLRLAEELARRVEEEEEEEKEEKTPKKKERRLESRVVEPLLETYEKRETSQFFLTNFNKSGVGQSRGGKGGNEEEEEEEERNDDERGEEKDDDDDDDEKMRRLFAHGVSDAHEYALQSTVEEEEEEEKETKEETFEDDSDDDDANNRSKTDEDIISIVWFKEEEKGEEENSVVAKIVHERFKEYVTVHDPYLRDDGLLLSYVDLENEKRVDAYAFDRADGFGTFRKTRVIFFTVERKEDGSDSEDLEREDGREEDDDGEISFTIRKIEETFRNCGIEEEDGGYGRDMRIERATFDSRTNAAVFEFLPKGTSLFGETKTWRKNEKKEDDCTNPGATVKEGQSEDENEKEEVNEDEEATEFIRKRLPFCVASFEEFGERANREAYSSARKALGDFFSSDAISKKRKNRKCDTVVQKPSVSESGVTTEEILDDKSRQGDKNEKGGILTELEQEVLRLELETASRRVAENSRSVLAQIDANKKHFQRHVLKERAESALRSVQKAKLLFEKTKVEEEAQREEEDLTSKMSATLENGGTGSSQQLADLSAAFRKARVNFIARQRRYDRARALFSSNGGAKKETTFCR
ncbi:unnamed protein product [Bathycoccus prasinos]|jgi:hypothetical protein